MIKKKKGKENENTNFRKKKNMTSKLWRVLKRITGWRLVRGRIFLVFTEALAKKKKFFWSSQWETHGYDVGGGKANHIALAFKWIYQPEEMEEASKTNGERGVDLHDVVELYVL